MGRLIAKHQRHILADRVSLAEYAVNWTVFALVSGIGFSIGPVIGGYLTQASHDNNHSYNCDG
jgi:ABC-type branched-subunit amino acid transport system permease subunit